MPARDALFPPRDEHRDPSLWATPDPLDTDTTLCGDGGNDPTMTLFDAKAASSSSSVTDGSNLSSEEDADHSN